VTLDRLAETLDLRGLAPAVSIGLERIYRMTPLAG
jgi:hypothetical protein